MKLKKISAVLFAFVCMFMFPFLSVNAGGWDYLGGESFYEDSHVHSSTGGDYRVCRDSSGPSRAIEVELWEYDPESYNDYVGQRYLSPGECGVFRSIGGFVDGGNEAEFFAKNRSSSLIYATFWD
ncbi:hypothetical protein [Pseudalkalibacillus decolorationis]|uniref:hypothetical protein n=1 Tax=Pseudalkalibacillus decolorationis TaxID=163879 RepID=UPI002147AFCD|nr:hypothetical protein [Pseudalkalibacillus decolorationis]